VNGSHGQVRERGAPLAAAVVTEARLRLRLSRSGR